MKPKVLIVDDDTKICELLKDILNEEEYEPVVANTTEDAWEQVNNSPPDLIILDMEIPLKGGLEFCRELKQSAASGSIPVIFLTVRNKNIDKIAAFNLGADDFVTKPFSYKELVARVDVAIRRSSFFRTHVLPMQSGTLTIDFERHIVNIKNQEVKLTPKEFEILKMLYCNRHRTVKNTEILSLFWTGMRAGESTLSTVYTHISRLRQKLKEHGNKIRTIQGIGFHFDERKQDRRKPVEKK